MEQLTFDMIMNQEQPEVLYIATKCNECKNECKVFCLSQDAIIYCKKFNKEN